MEVRLDLDRTLGVYFPGDTVTCIWYVTTSKPLTLHHLYTRCKGEVNTEWHPTQKTTITGHRLIFKQYRTLLGSHLGIPNPSGMIDIDQPDDLHYKTKIEIHNASTVAIGAGTFRFKTVFELPLNIPPSFESNDGRVIYELKLQSQPNYQPHRFHFIVAPILDLSPIPELSNPLLDSDEKTFGFGCMSSKPLTATLKVPAAGFAPGESTYVFVDIDNESDTRIIEVKMRLVEVLTYYLGSGDSKINRERVLWTGTCELDGGVIQPSERQEVFTELFFDPQFNFKFFTDVNFLIIAKYFIECEVVPTKYHSKLCFRSQIAIGTVPPENRLNPSDLIKVIGTELNNNSP